MKLYLTIIGGAMLIISAVNIVFHTVAWYYIILLVVICTAMQFALDGLIALTINKLPDRLFGAHNRLYTVSDAERKLYRKLKVRSWKDKIWELGGLGGFSKKNLVSPNSPEYIEKFIIECNKGVLTHRLSYPVGFLPMLFIPNIYAFSIVLPVAMVNLFLNILPTLALRYNTPKLQAMLKRMDDIVDDAFDRTKETLIHMISSNREDGQYCLDLLMIAKYLERIGDHATNIAEWVEFSITGQHAKEE